MTGKEATEKIKRLVKKERMQILALATLRFIAIVLACAFAFSATEALLRFGKDARTLIFIAFVACAFFSFARFVFPALASYLRKIGFRETVRKAIELGENFPQVKDKFANALELAENSDEKFSDALVKASIERAFSSLPDDFFSYDKKSFGGEFRKYAFIPIVVALVFIALPALRNGAYRIWRFYEEFAPPQKFFFVVAPRDTVVAKGDSLTLSVFVKGEAPEEFNLYVKTEGDAEFAPRRKFKSARKKFFYEFRKIENPFRYFFAAENVSSDTFDVAVVNPPFVREIDVTVYPPAYTGEKPLEIRGEGNITALKGSVAKLNVVTNKNVKSAFAVFSCSEKIPLEAKNGGLQASFRISKNCKYRVELLDSLGYRNRYPIVYSVEATDDEYPTVEILMPGKDVELGNEDVIPLVIKISDDYGFRRLLLKYRLVQSDFKTPGEKTASVGLPLSKSAEQTVLYDWNIRPLNIEVNDVYEYFVEVYDNDAVGGPKKAVSKKYKIHLPPLEEFLAKTEKENLKTLEEFRKSLREAEKLKREMEKLSNDLKKPKTKISWDEKKKVENAAKKFEELAKRAEKLKKELAEQQSELEKRNLLSPETVKKYEELQKLLSKLNDETLRKALQRMNKSLDRMQTDDVRKRLEELKKNEEAFRKSIERTIELFKRLLAEQKTDELLKRMEEIEKEQKKISEELNGKNSARKNDELTKRQAELKDKLKDLQKEAEKLSELMKDLDDMPSKEMEKLSEQMRNQKNEELAQKAAENMMMRNMPQAQQMQNRIMQNMAEMMQRMQNIRQRMRMQNQMKTMAEMMRLTREIISLSRKEEALKNKINSSALSNSEIRKLAAEQNEILNEIDMLLQRMQKLSNKTFAITPEMGNALGKARSQMQMAIGDLEERSRHGVRNKTQNAMAELNNAADMMQNMLNAMANRQGNGQGGMMSLMQQLQKMSGMQMQINAQTKQMRGQGKSQRQLAQMQRLAEQQAALQKSLDELNREARASGKSKQLAADLERVEQEMKEIVSDLQSGNLNDDLIKKQERILSRLLDAQRSINERDFEKRRESKAGKNIARKSPEELRLEEEARNRLERELLEAEKEGYKSDYRELIKKYYKRLKTEENNVGEK